MLAATCNRLFQISSEASTIEIDDSIVRRYASDTERDRESYTEVCDVCLSLPIILDVQACPILTSAPLDRGTSRNSALIDLLRLLTDVQGASHRLGGVRSCRAGCGYTGCVPGR
jgi:hypothetical protein